MRLGFAWVCAGGVLLAGCPELGGRIDPPCVLSVEAPVVVLEPAPVGLATAVRVRVSAVHDDCRVTAVRVTNHDGGAFTADGAEGGSGTLEQPLEVPRDQIAELALTFLPPAAGWYTATVTLDVANGSEAATTFDVRGRAAAPATPSDPVVLDFGRVPVGQVGQASLTVENTAGVDWVIEDISFSAADGATTTTELSSVQAVPYTVPARGTVQIDVRYTPVILRPMSADLNVDLGVAGAWLVHLIANDCENGVPDVYDVDRDGFTSCGGDCDDDASDVHPAAVEVPGDEVDQDCDPTTGP